MAKFLMLSFQKHEQIDGNKKVGFSGTAVLSERLRKCSQLSFQI